MKLGTIVVLDTVFKHIDFRFKRSGLGLGCGRGLVFKLGLGLGFGWVGVRVMVCSKCSLWLGLLLALGSLGRFDLERVHTPSTE